MHTYIMCTPVKGGVWAVALWLAADGKTTFMEAQLSVTFYYLNFKICLLSNLFMAQLEYMYVWKVLTVWLSTLMMSESYTVQKKAEQTMNYWTISGYWHLTAEWKQQETETTKNKEMYI